MAIGPGGTPTIPPRNVFHEAEAAEQDEEQAAKKANEVAVKALMLCMMCRTFGIMVRMQTETQIWLNHYAGDCECSSSLCLLLSLREAAAHRRGAGARTGQPRVDRRRARLHRLADLGRAVRCDGPAAADDHVTVLLGAHQHPHHVAPHRRLARRAPAAHALLLDAVAQRRSGVSAGPALPFARR